MRNIIRIMILIFLVITLICTILIFKQHVHNRHIHLKKIESNISSLKEYIDFLETEISYITSPENIEKIHKNNSRLTKIKEKQIISKNDFYILVE